ncbi:hypothetical protein [Nocardia abscessus]|uniref:hypothetical protein n=1 Tax=Nocardia abscessus TaxID=120957 RepID=UPI002455EC7D|nr:hypothetical protein [Nocardia abscessus]
MTARRGEVPRFLAEPVAVIVEVLGRVEPDLDPSVLAEVVEQVAQSRAGRRKLAEVLVRNPQLLTSGRAEGPPMVDRLIDAVRERVGRWVVPVCCGQCGRPAKRMAIYNADGLRICVTCDNHARGSFTPRACAVCERVLVPRSYDREGRPRCELCPPDPGVDHLEVLCDLIVALDPSTDREALREVIVKTVRQGARRRQLAWDLQDQPQLLTGQAVQGSLTVRRMVAALVEFGVAGVIAAQCPFCAATGELRSQREGLPCCNKCYQVARAKPCVRCGLVKPICTRTHDGAELCWSCSVQETVNKEICSSCGEFTAIATHRDGAPVCFGCRKPPSAVCASCGGYKPCAGAHTATPRCANCSHRARTAICARCSRLRPIASRDENRNPLCGNCALRRELCCRCGRLRPATGRVEDGALCWTCIKFEPAYFRACTECANVTRLHHHGLCVGCAAPRLLDALLAGPDGTVRPELDAARAALSNNNPVTLMNWLQHATTVAMLDRLAAAHGPVTHEVLDGLVPVGPARHLRQVLIAHQLLPDHDRQLSHLQLWFDAKLTEVADADEARALRGYLTWTHLRRLRNAGRPTTPHAVASIRTEVKSAIKLLDWLHARERNLASCTQADIDEWCMSTVRMPYRARRFLAWCAQRGHTGDVVIPVAPDTRSRTVFDNGDTRWQITRTLLHDDTIATTDRVAGLLTLLYGQTLSRIVRLTTDDVTHNEHGVLLRLGRRPLVLPTPLDELILELVHTRRGKAALGHTDNHRWLIPGGLPAQHMHPTALGKRLREIGVPARIARNTALMDNAAVMPTKVLSDLLGLSVTGAVRWSALAGTQGNAYAAEIVVRTRPPD